GRHQTWDRSPELADARTCGGRCRARLPAVAGTALRSMIPPPATMKKGYFTRAFDLDLPNEPGEIIIGAREFQCGRGRRWRPSQLRDDALESDPYLGRSRRRRSKSAGSARRTLPAVLAPDLFLRLPARPFPRRRAGSHPGFFSYDAGR